MRNVVPSAVAYNLSHISLKPLNLTSYVAFDCLYNQKVMYDPTLLTKVQTLLYMHKKCYIAQAIAT